MSLFGHLPNSTYLNEHANFHNFGRSLLLLFRMSTGTQCGAHCVDVGTSHAPALRDWL